MSLKDDVRRLIDRVRELEDRLWDLENGDGPDQIGFEVDENEGADFDPDDPEE